MNAESMLPPVPMMVRKLNQISQPREAAEQREELTSGAGKVVVNALYSDEQMVHSFGRPVMSVAMDPDFHRKGTKEFVCGGRAGQLVLNKKGRQRHANSAKVLLLTFLVSRIYLWLKKSGHSPRRRAHLRNKMERVRNDALQHRTPAIY